MINYHFPLIGGKVIERRISEWKNEGRVEGRAEERAEWLAWYNRRLEAERDWRPV